VGTPRWSPDGNWIVFDVFQSDPSIEIVGSGGGKPRRLSNGLSPRWSKDGRWIYAWCVPKAGTCRIPVEGGKMEKILDAATTVEISPDGAWLYYLPNGPLSSLRRIPISGGESEAVLSSIGGGQRFAVTRSGIWYMTPNTGEGSLLQYYDFASKSTRTVYRASRPFYSGFAISPDQRRVLFSQIERPQNHDLVLVEPYK
jgi:Tol biopolymer transport system component